MLPQSLSAQGTQVEFGKNRVQYHQEFKEWLKYESNNFITYWYGEGRNIGQSVVQMAEMDYDAVQNILEHRMNDRIEIIVYKDLTDLKQSNIGSEEAFVNTGGQTKIVGNKIFVYFNGDHNHLRRQVREGIANVYMNAMLFGSNLQEIVQNAVMLDLPSWFKSGLVAYVGQAWDTELDNQLRDLILRKEYDDFDRLSIDHPKLAGHAMWYFISQNYGRSTVSNLLYLTRINRSIDSGFLYVLGTTYKRTTESFMQYFLKRYEKESTLMIAPPEEKKIKIKNKRKLPITQMKMSPDGRKVVYVTNEIGKYKVYIQDVQTGKRARIMKESFRNAFQATDYNYPLLAWNPNNLELSIVYEKRDVIYLLRYDVNTQKTIKDVMPNLYHRIYSVDYLNVAQLVFSAVVRGYSDIFIYNMPNRQTRSITSDFWDDLDAKVVTIDSIKGVLFTSNRPDSTLRQEKLDTILPINDFDLFFYPLVDNEKKELIQITNTPFAHERQPEQIDSTWYTYLSDQSGIHNRMTGYLENYVAYYENVVLLTDSTKIVLHQDSTLESLDSSLILTVTPRPVYRKRSVNHNQTNLSRNIIRHSMSRRSGKMAQLIFNNGIYNIYVDSIPDPEPRFAASSTRFQQQMIQAAELSEGKGKPSAPPVQLLMPKKNESINLSDVPVNTETPQDTGKIDIDNYLFQSEFDDEEVPATVIAEEDDEEVVIEKPITPTIPSIAEIQKQRSRILKFRPGRITPYRTKFRTDYVTLQLDNSLLFGGLDSYAGTREDFFYPPLGILMKGNFKDLFEDYEVTGGIRIPTTFDGAEYFLIFDDKKKRLDKRYALYRRTQRFTQDAPGFFLPRKSQEIILLGQFEVRYPLDIFRSIRASATLRGDRRIQLSTDRIALEVPTQNQQRFGVKLEYVFDNTLDVALNIKNGTRYKVFTEFVKRMEVDVTDQFKFNFNEGIMTILGLDFRHYQRLDKKSILAVRGAAQTSFGSEQILYVLGGTDNWIGNRFTEDIPFPSSGDFAFQTLSTNLRGFPLNIRNGSSFALVNTELRVPVFRYFAKRIRSSFFRNFQLIGFFDVGTAWTGSSPFNKENPLNTINITTSNPTTVNLKVNYFRDPIVAGYGAGARISLFGYFFRLDYAWGIETRVVQDPVFYLSIGTDF